MLNSLLSILCYLALAPPDTCIHPSLKKEYDIVMSQLTRKPPIPDSDIIYLRWEPTLTHENATTSTLGVCGQMWWGWTPRYAKLMAVTNEIDNVWRTRAVLLHEIGHCMYSFPHSLYSFETGELYGPIVMTSFIPHVETEEQYLRLVADFNYHIEQLWPYGK